MSAVSVSLGDSAEDSICFKSRRSEGGPEEDHGTDIVKIELVRTDVLIVRDIEVEVFKACAQSYVSPHKILSGGPKVEE